MKKIVVITLLCSLVLTGCGSGSHSVKDDLNKDFGWIVSDDSENFLPEEYYEGGEQYFGNGKTENSDDIFTVLENKIWGDN
jgi:hypothetical protein